jgi:hypothetical protein
LAQNVRYPTKNKQTNKQTKKQNKHTCSSSKAGLLWDPGYRYTEWLHVDLGMTKHRWVSGNSGWAFGPNTFIHGSQVVISSVQLHRVLVVHIRPGQSSFGMVGKEPVALWILSSLTLIRLH